MGIGKRKPGVFLDRPWKDWKHPGLVLRYDISSRRRTQARRSGPSGQVPLKDLGKGHRAPAGRKGLGSKEGWASKGGLRRAILRESKSWSLGSHGVTSKALRSSAG